MKQALIIIAVAALLSMQHVEYSPFEINANGGSQFTIKPYINYMVDASKAHLIYKTFKTTDLEDISNKYIRNAVYQSFTDVTGKYTPDQLLKNREGYEREIYNNLKESIAKQGFILQQVTSNMVPPKSLVESIDAKNKADQDAQKIFLQVKMVEAQAAKNIAKAKGDSAAEIITAKGKAAATAINAMAEANYNKTVTQSITDQTIRYRFFEVWDGKLPTYGAVPQLFKDVR